MRHVIPPLALVLTIATGCPADPGGNPDGGIARAPTTMAINEVMTSNTAALADKDAEFDDWIELFNLTVADIPLDSFTLADSGATPALFPSGAVLPAGGFLLVFADDDLDGGTATEPHFPFKLSAGSGDTVTLTDPDGDVIDALPIPSLGVDTSYGSVTDGSADADTLASPTPRASNG